MLVLFLVCIVIFTIGCTVYYTNTSALQQHQNSINRLLDLRDHLLSKISTVESYKELIFDLPPCSALYVFDHPIEKIKWQKVNGVVMIPNMLDSETRQNILTRSLSGGGIIRIPWKQREKKTGNLRILSGVVFAIGVDEIGLLIICD